jgi:hypothetical protein
MTVSTERAHQAWRHAEQLKKLSDRLIGIGPFGIGLDGLVSWIPGANIAYSALAGAFLVGHGLRAQAKVGTLAQMLAYLVIDTATDTIPVIGWTADILFPGHLLAAKALQKDIEATHGLPPEEAERRERKRWGKKKKTRAGGIIEGSIVR